jgi:hypothetical protein
MEKLNSNKDFIFVTDTKDRKYIINKKYIYKIDNTQDYIVIKLCYPGMMCDEIITDISIFAFFEELNRNF